jgi:hypothetical protein
MNCQRKVLQLLNRCINDAVKPLFREPRQLSEHGYMFDAKEPCWPPSLIDPSRGKLCREQIIIEPRKLRCRCRCWYRVHNFNRRIGHSQLNVRFRAFSLPRS